MRKLVAVLLIAAAVFWLFKKAEEGKRLKKEAPEQPAAHQAAERDEGRLVQDPRYVLYLPAGMSEGTRYPLVVAFAPGGDFDNLAGFWRPIADNKRLIVMVSKKFRNDVDVEEIFREMAQAVEEVKMKYPVNASRVIAAGQSGGGMAAHMITADYPGSFNAIITNVGRINPYYYDPSIRCRYPRGKYAVFLASADDFNYAHMEQDREFLRDAGWITGWLEFSGGHVMAPPACYEQAIDMLKGWFRTGAKAGG